MFTALPGRLRHICLALIAALTITATAAVPADAHWLRWGRAKRAAKHWMGNRAPFYPDKVKTTWCNRWSAHEVHCGVWAGLEGYDSLLDDWTWTEECDATAIVKMRRHSRGLRVRGDHDMSCITY
jgi:hypothetical protein